MNEALKSLYDQVAAGVGVLPWSDRTLIELTGGDRAKFLHNLCTADIKSLQSGQGTEAFLCNVQGKILAHVFVFCHDDSLVLETVGSQSDSLMPHLDKYLITEDVQIVDRTGEWEQWLLAGPNAAKLLGEHWIDPYEVSLENYLDHCTAKNGWAIRAVRHGGERSYLVQCPIGDGEQLLAKCVEGGAVECDAQLVNVLRIENAIPVYGIDIDEKRLPQEIARDELAISFTKGCYLGQETVARIDALGHVNWRLVTVKVGDGTLTESDLPEAASELLDGEQKVGHVTSVTWSPKHSAPLVFALVRREAVESGKPLRLGEAEVTLV